MSLKHDGDGGIDPRTTSTSMPTWPPLPPTTTTTTAATIPRILTTPTRRSPFRGYNLPLDPSTFGVPLALTILVIIILCVVIGYTKVKRRHQRYREGATSSRVRSVSQRIPANTHAYNNYGLQLGPPVGCPEDCFPDQPPPYEVAIQTPPPAGPQAFQPLSVGLPPAYSETGPSSRLPVRPPETRITRPRSETQAVPPPPPPPPTSDRSSRPTTEGVTTPGDSVRDNVTQPGDHKDLKDAPGSGYESESCSMGAAPKVDGGSVAGQASTSDVEQGHVSSSDHVLQAAAVHAPSEPWVSHC